MARRKGKYIVGKIRNMVHRVINGVEILQSAPGKGGVRQTKATKKSANLFGKASALAKNIRLMLINILKNYDGTMIYRMTTVVSAIIRQCYDKKSGTYTFDPNSFDSLIGFDFNADSPLKESLWLLPQSKVSEGLLTVTIPESQIPSDFKFPKTANTCIIRMGFTLFNPEQGLYYKHVIEQEKKIQIKEAILEKQEFILQIPEGCLCIAAVVLEYYKFTNDIGILLNSKAFHPSAICAAYLNPGTFNPEKPSAWAYNNKINLQ